MYLKLKVLYNDMKKEEKIIRTFWQDQMHGTDRIYYEEMYDDEGQGQWLVLNNIRAWCVTPYELEGAIIDI